MFSKNKKEPEPLYYPEKPYHPLDYVRNELDDPPYMTNPYFELPKLEPRPNPYAVTKPTVKPHELKSLQKAHPEPQEVKSLPKMPAQLRINHLQTFHTTTSTTPNSIITMHHTTTHRPPIIPITTTEPIITPHGEPTVTFDHFKSSYFGLPLKDKGLKRPPTIPTLPPPITTEAGDLY